MRGRKPVPKAGTLANSSLNALPRCPSHLNEVARKEWRRLATPLHEVGILTLADRAVLAAYCQAYARWVQAEEKLGEGPALIKTPSGYVQQSPWLTVANKQMELMGRYMSELGLTPVARTRVDMAETAAMKDPVATIKFVTVYTDKDGNSVERPFGDSNKSKPASEPETITYELDPRL